MSSIKDRQRAAARARLEKEMAERSAAARKRRQRQAVIGSALALIVVVAGTAWLVTALGDDDDKGGTTTASGAGTTSCVWNAEAAERPQVKDVGTPPTSVPNVGTKVLTIDTNFGPISAAMDLSKVPCTAASFALLASKNFYNNTKCHRMGATENFKVLQCGDPFATGKGYRLTDGTGGSTYKFAEENLPKDQDPPYPSGTIAMANEGKPATTGSQFFIVFGDTRIDPDYTVVGKITGGLDIVKKVGDAGHDKAFEPTEKEPQKPGGGHPKLETIIKSVAVANG